MHGFEELAPANPSTPASGPWHRELNRYHWFVLIVAALGWLFDTMDQQLFNLARVPAMKALLHGPDGGAPDDKLVALYGGYATSIFLIGWATGGLAFGVLGDRIGRAKTMLLTILIYSLCTGLSALSTGFWDFAFYRFITGLGVGGEFAVGVSLVAEVMPDRARPFALGLLQALSAVGNITAAIISMVLGRLEETGAVGSAWRWMFVIGTVPALLAILIRRRLKEPERWQKTVAESGTAERRGSYAELFGDPRWRRRALVGMTMAFAGVVGLWGIGFFSVDLIRLVLRKHQAANDIALLDTNRDGKITQSELPAEIQPRTQAALDAAGGGEPSIKELSEAVMKLNAATGGGYPLEFVKLFAATDSAEITLADIPEAAKPRFQPIFERAKKTQLPTPELSAALGKANAGNLTLWAGITSMVLNIGAFFGIYGFSYLTHYIGRRTAFAIAYVAAMFSTAAVFAYLDSFSQIFWMIPLMGFCQLALFGGYAIYFPELFPTRLRSTGTSFCYNVGRFVAAIGPSLLGLLTSEVFKDKPEPMRYAGVTMCAVFILGLLVLPFAPETKGQPLPE